MSKYLRIYANPRFFAIYSFIGIFMSVCEDTLTSILPSSYTTRVAVRIISPRTFPFTSSREGSLVQSTHHSLPLRKVKRTYSKSREDMMSTFL